MSVGRSRASRSQKEGTTANLRIYPNKNTEPNNRTSSESASLLIEHLLDISLKRKSKSPSNASRNQKHAYYNEESTRRDDEEKERSGRLPNLFTK